MFAVFVFVFGLGAGAYLGIAHQDASDGSTHIAVRYVGDPIDPVEEQRAQHEATDGYQQERLREEASRSASRDAQRKAAAGTKDAAEVAQEADAAKEADDQSSSSTSGGGDTNVGPVPTSCQQYSGNRQTGCTLMVQDGFAVSQMSCLDNVWTRESGWNQHAGDVSAAYGIPQANPGSKMASFGDDWQDNPATQIKWGLDYIKGRYGSPCGAWSYWQDHGWY
jgi:hypothetical protein